MQKLSIPTKAFTDMLPDLIASGVTFDAEERNGWITITFTGGY